MERGGGRLPLPRIRTRAMLLRFEVVGWVGGSSSRLKLDVNRESVRSCLPRRTRALWIHGGVASRFQRRFRFHHSPPPPSVCLNATPRWWRARARS